MIIACINEFKGFAEGIGALFSKTKLKLCISSDQGYAMSPKRIKKTVMEDLMSLYNIAHEEME